MPWHSKKHCPFTIFCVFQTKFNKAVNNVCRLPEWIRNVQMIPGLVQDFDDNLNENRDKDLDKNLAWLTQKTEDPKSNKGNLTFPTQIVNV